MGVGPENDLSAGPDYDESVGDVAYRMSVGRGTPALHDPSPWVLRADWSAIITAAEASLQTLTAHLAAQHPALSAWWLQRTTAQRQRLHAAIVAGRGL